MFLLSHLHGFNAAAPGVLYDRYWVYVETASSTGNLFCAEVECYDGNASLISQSGGTYLSDMVTGGTTDPSSSGNNIGRAFDSTTSADHDNCAYRGSVANCYVGRNFASAQSISKARFYPSNNLGFSGDSIGNMTLTLYGLVGSFTNATTGTVLATQSGIARTSTAMVELVVA